MPDKRPEAKFVAHWHFAHGSNAAPIVDFQWQPQNLYVAGTWNLHNFPVVFFSNPQRLNVKRSTSVCYLHFYDVASDMASDVMTFYLPRAQSSKLFENVPGKLIVWWLKQYCYANTLSNTYSYIERYVIVMHYNVPYAWRWQKAIEHDL